MRAAAILIFFAVGLASCGVNTNTSVDRPDTSCIDSTLIKPEAICTMIYAPVCGCDGKTYSSPCMATNSGGVTSYTEGECSTKK